MANSMTVQVKLPAKAVKKAKELVDNGSYPSLEALLTEALELIAQRPQRRSRLERVIGDYLDGKLPKDPRARERIDAAFAEARKNLEKSPHQFQTVEDLMRWVRRHGVEDFDRF